MATPKLAPTTSPAPKGFGPLRCLLCGAEGGISLHLTDLQSVHCHECSDEFSVATLRDHVARWSRVVAWIDLAAGVE
jgi:hypothetical protein